MTKRVAVINDLSGLGRCSLTAAIPVLSALGVQACPVPTAVLSAQTGFPGYRLQDLTDHMGDFLTHWQQLGMTFDGISTGFLSSVAQAEGVLRFLDAFPGSDTLILVDPVMGDDGAIYPGYGPELRQRVRRLVERAGVVTPNLTEACLLTGADYASVAALEGPALFDAVAELGRRIQAMGPGIAAITGVRRGEHIYNVILDREGRHLVGAPLLGGSYSGTGDLFAAVLHGCLLRGMQAAQAAELAVTFLSAALADTLEAGADRNHGVFFEAHMDLLTGASF